LIKRAPAGPLSPVPFDFVKNLLRRRGVKTASAGG